MACINPDGTLSVVARGVLVALDTAQDAQALVRAVGVPPYRIRQSFREMGPDGAGLIGPVEDGQPQGPWRITPLGREALALAEEG